MVYQDLLLNLSLLVTLSLLYGYLLRWVNVTQKQRQVISGVLFGVMAVLVMTMPVHHAPGVIYDSRSIVLSTAGLFGGGVPAFIAAGFASVYRLWIGGAGTLAGIVTIASTTGIGLIARWFWSSETFHRAPLRLLGFGVIATMGMLAAQLLIPWPLALQILREIWLPVLVFFPAGTVLLGMLLADHKYRTHLHQTLRDRERRYRSLIENHHVTMLLIDPEHGTIVDANPAACRFYGYSRTQLQSMKIEEINTLSPDEIQDRMYEAEHAGRDYFEFRHRLADGSIRDVSVYTGSVTMDGRTYLFSHIFDITNRKRAEEALKAKEEHLRTTLHSIGDAVITTDIHGRITRMNPTAESLTGWEQDTALGRPIREVWHIVNAKSGAPGNNPVHAVLQTGKTSNLANDTLLISKDGTQRQIADTAAPIIDDTGQITGVVLVFKDVTKEYQQRQRIRESEEKFRTVFATSPDAVTLTRFPEGQFLDMNPGFTRLIGYTRDEVLGLTASELGIWQHSADRERLIEHLEHHGVVHNMEVELVTKAGQKKIGLLSAQLQELQGERIMLAMTRDVTDHRSAEHRSRSLWQHTNDGMRLTDEHGVIRAVNPAFCRMVGLDQASMEGRPLSVLYLEDSDRILQKHQERYRERTIPEHLEGKFTLHNGEERWFDVTNTRLEIPGEPSQVLATFRDITRQKIAERTLARHRELLQQTERLARIGGWEYDVATGRMFLTEEYKRIFSLAQVASDQYLEASYERYPEEVRDRITEAFVEAVDQGRPYDIEVPFRTQATKARWVRTTAEPVIIDGEVIRVFGNVMDITEYKDTEQALRESEARYRVLMETAPDLILVHDMEGIIRYANAAVSAVTGYKQDSIINRSVYDLLPPEEMKQLHWRKAKRQNGGEEIRSFETTIVTSEGKRVPLEVRTAPLIRDGSPTSIMAVGRDLRKRKELEARLRQAEKMDAIGQLAGGIAHDFNNKLTVILGQTDLALAQFETERGVRHALEEVRRAAQDSADLTRQLLTFARQQTAAPEILDLNKTIADLLSMLETLISEAIDLVWKPGADLWQVQMDPTQVDQILANLVINARDAIGDVGRILIETENVVVAEADVGGYPEMVPGDYVVLTVTDTGCGMEPEISDKIFDPFFTTKSEGEGTGLGLATVYGIVKQNDGFIHVYSEPGEGTTFKIYVSRVVQPENVDDGNCEAGLPQTGDETLLIVEDDPAILQLSSLQLRGVGYTVFPANSPEDAMVLAQEGGETLDLLLTDVIMPGMNGRDLAEQIQQWCPEIKVLFMSGYPSDVIGEGGVLEPGLHFLQKPFSRETLARKVRETLDTKLEPEP